MRLEAPASPATAAVAVRILVDGGAEHVEYGVEDEYANLARAASGCRFKVAHWQ